MSRFKSTNFFFFKLARSYRTNLFELDKILMNQWRQCHSEINFLGFWKALFHCIWPAWVVTYLPRAACPDGWQTTEPPSSVTRFTTIKMADLSHLSTVTSKWKLSSNRIWLLKGLADVFRRLHTRPNGSSRYRRTRQWTSHVVDAAAARWRHWST